MSRVYFHSKDGSAHVSGSERGKFALLVRGITYGILRPYAKDVCELITPPRNGESAERHLEYAISSILTDSSFVVDGKLYDSFGVGLNTALRVGSPAVQFAARIDGQCEIFAWFEAEHRAGIKKIIESGMVSGVFSRNAGWDGVISLLDNGSDSEIVMSYSVCHQFPPPRDDDSDVNMTWDDGVGWLKGQVASKLQIIPDELDSYRFGWGMDAIQLIEAIRGRRSAMLEETP